jgi:MGT family glycosyltransferase
MNQGNHFHLPHNLKKDAKILFACFAADGHFNPLTGIAVHLKQQGYDVRWYTSPGYKAKIDSYGIPFYPLKQATDFYSADPEKLFPEREKAKSQIAKFNFDLINVFIKEGPAFYNDLKEIHASFPFELLIADITFTGIPFVSDLMKIPVIGVGIVPITKNSKDLPPAGLGMLPSYHFFGRMKQHMLRFVAKHILFSKSNKEMKRVFNQYGIETTADNVFDLMITKCKLVLQTGTPGFDYKRSDLDSKYKFVGPLLPHTVKKKETTRWYDERLSHYKKVVLVTQGTVEKDESKLLVPTLEALRNTSYLVVVTTGGSKTEELRRQYNAPNVIIEDYIPFADIMPYADVYITNGGMGGVQLSIENKLPMVTAGVHEGKNEICARVGYFNLGINLKTERPSPEQIRAGVEQVVNNEMYRKNVTALCEEFSRYKPFELSERYVQQLLPALSVQQPKKVAEPIY